MATIHPSRMGLVPQAPPPRRPSPTPPPPTREEELRRRLLEKRKNKNGHTEAGSSRSQSGEGGSRSPSRASGGLQIKGSSRVEKEESPLPDIYRSSPSRPREREHSPGPAGLREARDHDDSPRRRHVRAYERDDGRPRSRSRSRSRERDRRPSPSYAPPRPDDRSRDRGYGYSDRRDDLRSPPGSSQQLPPNQWPPFPPKNGYPPRAGSAGAPPPPPVRNGYGGPPPPPMRMGFDRSGGGVSGGYGGYGGYGGGKPDFERRRQEREDNPLSIWPPSPKRPYREEEDMETGKSKKKSKKSKSKRRRRYSDDSESTDTEDERERRRRRKRDKERRRRHEDDVLSGSEAEDRKRRRYTPEVRERSKSRRIDTPSRSLSPAKKDWIEKDKAGVATQPIMAGQGIDTESEDEGDAVGPQLPAEHKDRARRQQFKDMLPGEAAAMAAFASSGQRIPRRGEIGLDSNKIEEFEASGFVMSGNRNKRMNAVRLRKENQVISAEEKRAILNLQKEERMKKEGAIISQFKELLDDNWRSQGLKEGHHE